MLVKKPDPNEWVQCLRCGWLGTLRDSGTPANSLAGCPRCRCLLTRHDDEEEDAGSPSVGALLAVLLCIVTAMIVLAVMWGR